MWPGSWLPLSTKINKRATTELEKPFFHYRVLLPLWEHPLLSFCPRFDLIIPFPPSFWFVSRCFSCLCSFCFFVVFCLSLVIVFLSFLPSFRPLFLGSFIPWFLSLFLLSCFLSCFLSFFLSFLLSFVRSFFLSVFFPSFLPSFLRSFLPSFLPSFLSFFLPFLSIWVRLFCWLSENDRH